MLKAFCKLIRVLCEIFLGFGVFYYHFVHAFTADFSWDTESVVDAFMTHVGMLSLGLIGIIVGLHGVREVFRAFKKEFPGNS